MIKIISILTLLALAQNLFASQGISPADHKKITSLYLNLLDQPERPDPQEGDKEIKTQAEIDFENALKKYSESSFKRMCSDINDDCTLFKCCSGLKCNQTSSKNS